MSRQQVVDTARSFLGAKWRHRGRNNFGIDCIGLIVIPVRAGGFNIADRADYGREPWQFGLQAELKKQFGNPIPEDEWQIGDIALFDLPGKEPCHVGVLADYAHGGFSVIHAQSSHNVSEHVLDKRWRKRLVEVYSIG